MIKKAQFENGSHLDTEIVGICPEYLQFVPSVSKTFQIPQRQLTSYAGQIHVKIGGGDTICKVLSHMNLQ